jgi:uncharacterized Zn-finger protein
MKGNLNEHIKNIHESTRKLCGICGKKFNNNGDLNNHDKIHGGEKREYNLVQV